MVNGVSQQPYTLRLASQAELQENGLSTVSQGLMKRPPTRHIKKLGDPITGTAFIHTINRDATEQYTVVVTNGDLKVYDLAGNEKTVNFPDGKGYLVATDPAKTFRAITVADYTFLLNKKVVVTEDTDTVPARPYEALVVVRSGQYGKTYTISINDTVKATRVVPNGETAADAPSIVTNHIASELSTGLTASGVTHTLSGSVIQIYSPTDFTIKTSDGYGDSAMYAIKDKAQRFSDLPANGVADGFTIEVVGDVNTSGDNHWVRFDIGTSGGVWRETVKPGIRKGFIGATMPWALVREADGTFTFQIIEWGKRTVGDLDSAPNPSFVGRTISDIFFYRNRLGLLADESVMFSEAGKFFNFYPTTVAQLLDSDPIDHSVSHTKVSILNYAIPFNKRLLLFSTQTQFSVESGDILTGKSMAVKPTTEFECSPGVAPVGVGRNIYFACPKGDYEGLREYFIADTTETEDAAEVTSHVPKYIPSGVYKIAAALNEDLLCVLSSGRRNRAYIYKFYWNNNEKLQSSWSEWVFPETDQILHADFVESQLFLVINRPDGLYLESIETTPGDTIEGEPYTVHLDRKLVLPAGSGTFDGTNTTIPIPFPIDDGVYAAVVATNQPRTAGTLLEVLDDGSGGAFVKGDFSDCNLIVGRRYAFRYKLSPLMIRTNGAQGQKSDTVGRLQIRKLTVNFSETGYFQAMVTPLGRDTYTYTYTGKILGLPSATLGAIQVADGQFSFPVLSQNTTVDIELYSDSPLPCAFLSVDWEGFYVRRSKSV